MEHLIKIKEAHRYLDNAKDTLKKAGREDGYYKDPKYVSTACETAYKGVLIALDEYLQKKERPIIKKKHQRKNEHDYTKTLAELNKTLLHLFNSAYHILHLDGYYDGVSDKDTIDLGFKKAETIITGIEHNKF